MIEQIVLACECGATVKCSDIDGITKLAVERIWKDIHIGHERVTCAEARDIRTSISKSRPNKVFG